MPKLKFVMCRGVGPSLSLGLALSLFSVLASLAACGPQPAASSVVTPIKPTRLSESSVVTKAPMPEDWPSRWLDDLSCKPPCWEGVTPGETTPEEAVDVLSRSPLINTVAITASPLIPQMGYVIWQYIDTQRGGEAIFDAEVPHSPIYIIYPSFPKSFALGEVIEAYGEPSHVIARLAYPPDIGGDIYYELRILYRHRGLILIDMGGKTKPVLDGDTRFETVVFFAPNEDGWQAGLGGAAAHPEWLVPWQGMQDFDFYCRDEEGQPCEEDGR